VLPLPLPPPPPPPRLARLGSAPLASSAERAAPLRPAAASDARFFLRARYLSYAHKRGSTRAEGARGGERGEGEQVGTGAARAKGQM
jgi:hypothetical protein